MPAIYRRDCLVRAPRSVYTAGMKEENVMRYTLIALLLTGCTAGAPIIVDSSPSGVSVSRAKMIGSSGMLSTAEAHCQKYGKRAEFVGRSDDFTNEYACR